MTSLISLSGSGPTRVLNWGQISDQTQIFDRQMEHRFPLSGILKSVQRPPIHQCHTAKSRSQGHHSRKSMFQLSCLPPRIYLEMASLDKFQHAPLTQMPEDCSILILHGKPEDHCVIRRFQIPLRRGTGGYEPRSDQANFVAGPPGYVILEPDGIRLQNFDRERVIRSDCDAI